MKKVSNRILSFVLAITIIFGSAYAGLTELDWDGLFAVEAKAEDNDENTVLVIEDSTETEDDYVYYSELFYGYSHYLANDIYFQSYVGASNGIYNRVHESYQNSPLVVGTGISHALDIITSPTEIAKLITDTYGLTDFSYNDALDAANEAFVAYMMTDTLSYSVKNSYGKVAKINNQINTMVTYFNKLNVIDTFGDAYTAEDIVRDAYNYLWDKGCLSFISEEMLSNLWVEINSDKFSLNNCFKLAKNEIDIACAIVTALMMENIRLELIEDVISLQTSDTVLKQGMVRLRNKLRGGFVSYFIENYLLEKLADDLFGVVDKALVSGVDAVVNGSITSAEIKAMVAVAKKVFDYVVDVPGFDEVLKWQVLIAYSYDMSETIKNKAISFTTGPFLSDEILKYENYFILYDAINKATMAVTSNIARMLDPFGEAYTVLEEARANNISEVTITSGVNSFNIPSTTTNEELYAILITDTYVNTATGNVYALLKEIKISNGIRTVKVSRKANMIGSIVKAGVSENWDLIYTFNQACNGVSLYEEHIKSTKNTILNTHISERIPVSKEVYSTWTYSVNNSIKLMEDSDTIETNCIYGFNNTILGNVEVIQKSTLKIPQDKDITVDGNICVWSDNHLKNDGKLTVTGNVQVGWRSNFVNNNEIIINGSLDCNDSTSSSFTNNGTIKSNDCLLDSHITFSTSADSMLYVSGDFTCNGRLNGTIVFDGKTEQSVKGLNVDSVIVENNCGLKYLSDASIYGPFYLNGNSLNCNGYKTYANTGTRFNHGDYGLIIAVGLTLLDSVNADIEVDKKTTLKIPQDKDITVDGNICVWSDNHLKNDGKLTVTGNVQVGWRSNFVNNNEIIINGSLDCNDSTSSSFTNNGTIKSNDCLLDSHITFSTSADSMLYVSGDFTCNGTLLNGAVVFDGEKGQSISGLNVPTIIIDNTSDTGVIFNTAIAPSILFNHNGNAFSLTSGSKFVDYDGDGLKDNIDPEPTVGNPCTITVATENVEKGTVLESFDSIGGTTVTASAEPTFKYDFYCWKNASGSIVSYNSNYTFVTKGDVTLTAYFTKRQRNISVDTVNGTISVPSKAEIESTVTVTPVANEGCLYTDGSITVNGESVTGNSFIMPDEDVVLSAHFYVNDYYFALKEVLTEAINIDQTKYSKRTVSVLQLAIENAHNSLVNDISQEESEELIAELQAAMNDLVFVTGTCGDSLVWNYDEEIKTLTITGTGEMHDYTNSYSPWEPLGGEIEIIFIGRGITSIGDDAFNYCRVLTDVYYGYTEEGWNTLSIGANNEYLTSANIHFHIHNFVGTVTLNPTCVAQGKITYNCDCGDIYEECIDALGHNYSTEWTVDVVGTCTNDGSKSRHCAVCGDKTDVTIIVATGHVFTNEICQVCGYSGVWNYELYDENAVILSYVGDDTDVIIPDFIGGVPVTKLNANCIPSGVTKVNIPATVTNIDSQAFNCETLESITVDENNTTYTSVDGILYSADQTSILRVPEAYAEEDFEFLDSVVEIGDYAFYGCKNFNSIVIPDNVTRIGEYAFKFCSNLADVHLSNSALVIGRNAFESIAITEIILPENIISIGVYAFSDCTELQKISYNIIDCDIDAPNQMLLVLGAIFLKSNNITEVTIGENVKEIPSYLFTSQSNIVSVHISSLEQLCGINFGGGLGNPLSFAEELYLNGELITEIVIPETVETINKYAFYNFKGFTSITIPHSVKSIETKAFYGCSNLKYAFYTGSESDWNNITIGTDNTLLTNLPIHYNSTDHTYSSEWTVDVEPTCTASGSKSHHCLYCDAKIDVTVIDKLVHDYVPQGMNNSFHENGHEIKYVCSRCGAEKIEPTTDFECIECDFEITIIDGTGYKLIKYIGDGADVVIPSAYEGLDVTTIGNSCFKGNIEITSVEIEKGVTTIGSLAFMNCASLEKVVVPASVTSIGTQAFYGFTGTIYCTSGSVAHKYAVDNNIKYVLVTDGEPEKPIQETDNTQIDYENSIIRTDIENCDDIIEIFGLSESAIAIAEASYVCGNLEFYGTGTIITVFDGNQYIGDFTLVVNGDVNGDSVCDALDAVQVALASRGQKPLDGAYKMAADGNSDDVIDINDYQAVVNKAVS